LAAPEQSLLLPAAHELDCGQKETDMLKRGTLSVALTLISGVTAAAQQAGGTLQPSPEHMKLGVFVGTWQDEAEIKPSPLGPGGRMSLSETCEWFTGGFSIVCHTETLVLIGHMTTLTVLTYDPDEKVYRFYEFNSAGRSNSAKGTVDGDTWTFEGESKAGGKSLKSRSTIKFSSPDSATMKSEMSAEGGPWTLVMELTGTRAKQSQTDLNSCVPHGSEGWPFELFACYRRLLSSH
jgi:Protein of unknown function (DUF1579)